MCELYKIIILNNIKKFNGEIFNAGTENLKIIDVAEKVKNILEKRYDKTIDIKIEESSDIRSYMINSDKIKNFRI